MAEPEQPKTETVRIDLPEPAVTRLSETTVQPYETARIQLPVRDSNLFPPPNPPPAAKSLMPMPSIVPKNLPIGTASAEKSSMLLYWVLLAISAFILIIQIWTYVS